MNVSIKLVVAAINAAGERDLLPVIVTGKESHYENGEFYIAAENYAEEKGYESPLAFDENDPGGQKLISLYTWDNVEPIEFIG